MSNQESRKMSKKYNQKAVPTWKGFLSFLPSPRQPRWSCSCSIKGPPHLPLTQFAVDVFDGFITRSRFLCGSHTWLTCAAGGRIEAKGGVMSHQCFRKVVDDLVGLFCFVGPTDMYLCIYIYSQHLKQKELGNIYFYWILQPFPVPFRWNHGGSLENHQFKPHDVHEGLKWRGFIVAMFSSLETAVW